MHCAVPYIQHSYIRGSRLIPKFLKLGTIWGQLHFEILKQIFLFFYILNHLSTINTLYNEREFKFLEISFFLKYFNPFFLQCLKSKNQLKISQNAFSILKCPIASAAVSDPWYGKIDCPYFANKIWLKS